MSHNKLMFLLLSFSSIIHLLGTIVDPAASWKSWLVNIAIILLALLFLNLTIKENQQKVACPSQREGHIFYIMNIGKSSLNKCHSNSASDIGALYCP
ncbi:hypothetical protein E0L19_17415 [Bacillus paralicheniformis]|nr:hypothetical protein [Bacillus paralicheniformis]